LECILLSRFLKKTKTLLHYTVCNGEQSLVGIELDDLSETHKDDDDAVENVGDIGDDVACGIGNIGEMSSVDVEPSK
jgi:hypothetical protein